MAPWTLYNVARFERPVLLSTNDGTTLLGANCDTTYYVDIGGWDIRCLAPVPTDEPIDASVRSVARRDHRRRLHRRPPRPAARRRRRPRSAGSSTSTGCGSLVALDRGEEKAEWAVWAGIVAWWVLAVAVDRRLGGARATRRRIAGAIRARWWLVVPLGAVLVTTVLFYGAHRIRAPAEPVVVVLAAVGLVAAWDRVRSRPAVVLQDRPDRADLEGQKR